MDDKTILKRISEGDRKAFDILTDHYYDSLCAFAFKIINDYEAAEDVVQDSFVKLWVNRNKVAELSYEKTYIYAIVKNLSISYLRSQIRRDNLHSNYISESIEEDISRYFIEQETFRMITDAIDQLPPRTSEVIKLTLEGLRQEKIAETMGITVPTVKALKADGIKKLQKSLGELSYLLAHCSLLLLSH